MVARRRPAGWRAAALVLAVAIPAVSACGSDDAPATSSPSAAPIPPAQPIDSASCRQAPPKGEIDRSGQRLAFRSGNIKIAIGSTTGSQRNAPGGPGTGDVRCYEFTRWGPEKPDVPPDSLLFVFKGNGTDGAQIEFLVSELTGGNLPPIGNSAGTRAGPLDKPLNAQIGVSVGGIYHQSPACQLTVTGMSDDLAAGSFSCPAAAREDANPFAPSDDVPFDADETSTPGPASSKTVTVSGWFQLTP